MKRAKRASIRIHCRRQSDSTQSDASAERGSDFQRRFTIADTERTALLAARAGG